MVPTATHASAAGFGGLDLFDRLGFDLAPFTVHRMVGQRIGLDRAEGVEPDVERDPYDGDSAVDELPQHFVGEVQSGRRGGDGSGMPVVDRLVPLSIFFVHFAAANVFRQRHASHAVKQLETRLVGLGTCDPQSARLLLDHPQPHVFAAMTVQERNRFARRDRPRVRANSRQLP